MIFNDAPGVSAPFAGTKDGYCVGWLLTYGDRPGIPTLNRVENKAESKGPGGKGAAGAGFIYAPAVFGTAPSLSLHVTEGGDKYLYCEGKPVSLSDAVERGLAWRLDGVEVK